jgi:phage terminase large subunit
VQKTPILSKYEQLTDLQKAIPLDPSWFLRRGMDAQPWSIQELIVQSVFDNPVTTVRSCHGIGKSWLSAKVALAFLTAYTDSYVITTAPTFRQVENIIWRDIRATYKRMTPKLGGRLFASPLLNITDEWFAMGFAAKDPDKFQGFHAPSGYILVIVDEAAGVTEDIWVAIDAILSSGGARLLMIGNPTSLSGRFYQSHHIDPNSKKFHVSCFDTPNFTNNGIRNVEDLKNIDLDSIEVIAPHLITPEWVHDKIRKWGEESPMFQARCLGDFPSAEVNTLIPLNFIEAAATEERREELEAKQKDPLHFIGVDPARYGDDKSVITERWGGIVNKQVINGKEDTTQTAGRVKQLKPAAGIFVDVDGVGAGVADTLRSDKIDNVVDIHGSAGVGKNDQGLEFVNLRARVYWELAEAFKRGEISIPEDGELMAQLSAIRYEVTRRGIKIEEKSEIKKRTLVSPDQADSLAYSYADFLAVDLKAKPALAKPYQGAYNNGRDIDW